MMFATKAPLRVKLIALIMLLIGMFDFFIGVSHARNTLFLIIGVSCIILGIGIVNLWNWARIAIITFSLAFILLLYVPLIVGTTRGYWQNWGGLGLMVHFPLLVLCLLCLVFLRQPKIKEQFTKTTSNPVTGPTIGIKTLVLVIFGVAILNIYMGFDHPEDVKLFVFGLLCSLLGIGIFKRWGWAREAMIALSSIIVFMVLSGVMFRQPFSRLARSLPLFGMSIVCIALLTRPRIKDQFMKRKEYQE